MSEHQVASVRPGPALHRDPARRLHLVHDHPGRVSRDRLPGLLPRVVAQVARQLRLGQRTLHLLRVGDDRIRAQLAWRQVLSRRHRDPHERLPRQRCPDPANCGGTAAAAVGPPLRLQLHDAVLGRRPRQRRQPALHRRRRQPQVSGDRRRARLAPLRPRAQRADLHVHRHRDIRVRRRGDHPHRHPYPLLPHHSRAGYRRRRPLLAGRGHPGLHSGLHRCGAHRSTSVGATVATAAETAAASRRALAPV